MEHAVESTKRGEHKGASPILASNTVIKAKPFHPMLQLQQQAGNQAMQELLRSRVIQAKHAISHPDDPEEQEADHVAERIMRSNSAGFPISAPCSCGEDGEMCEECRKNQAVLHRRASSPGAPANVPRVVSQVLRSPGHPLDSSTRAFFEPRFGRDLSHVRIHSGAEAAVSARSIQAHAYTAGSDIVFAQGQYAPGSSSGRRLLAHELTHVAQQEKTGATARLQRQPADDANENLWTLAPFVGPGGHPIEIGFINAPLLGISGPLPAGTVRQDKDLTVTQSTDNHVVIEYAGCSIEITAEPGGTYTYYIDDAVPRPEPPQTLPFFTMPNSGSLVNIDYETHGIEKPPLILHQSYGPPQSTAPSFGNGGVEEWWFTRNSVQLTLDNTVAKITVPADDPSLQADNCPDARFAYSIDPDWTGPANLEKRVFIIASPGVRLLEGQPNEVPALDFGRKLVPIMVHVPHPDLVPEQGTVIHLENFVSTETVGYTPEYFGADSPEKHSSALTVAQGLSGVTIKHPWSGSRVSIRPADPSIGASYAWQVVSSPGVPAEIRIVTAPGAFIEFVEPVPSRFGAGGGTKLPPLAGEWESGEGLKEEGVTLRIVEIDDNSAIPVPGTPLNIDYYLGHGHLREPDVHDWSDLDETALKAMDFVIRLTPIVGQLYGIGEFIHAARFGEDLMGHKLPPGGLVLMGAGVVISLIPEVGPALSGAGKLVRLASALGKTTEEIEVTALTLGRLASEEDQALLTQGAQTLEEGGEIAAEEVPEMESALSRVAPGVSLRGGIGGEALSFAADASESFSNPQFAAQVVQEFQQTGELSPALVRTLQRAGVKEIEEQQAIVRQFLRDAASAPESGIENSTIDEIVEKLPEAQESRFLNGALAEEEGAEAVAQNKAAWSKMAGANSEAAEIFETGRDLKGVRELTIIDHGVGGDANAMTVAERGAARVNLTGVGEVTPEQLAEILEKNGWEGGHIRLMACRTGLCTETTGPFAEQLSEALGQRNFPTVVAAPTGKVTIGYGLAESERDIPFVIGGTRSGSGIQGMDYFGPYADEVPVSGAAPGAGPDLAPGAGPGPVAGVPPSALAPTPSSSVLVVGAETDAEFAYAQGVRQSGGHSTVVNPRVTDATVGFQQSGGTFVQGMIEDLPADARFDFIREDYPYPLGPMLPQAESFVAARLARLNPKGTWVLITEAPEFADSLEIAGARANARVTVDRIPLYHEATPQSSYPREMSRYVLTFTK
jgi:hypothetical protein